MAKPASKAALGRYLAAGLGATGLASVECEAGIVNFDITAIGNPLYPTDISGVNAGLGENTVGYAYNLIPGSGGGLALQNFSNKKGLEGINAYLGAPLQIANNGSEASPKKFTAGDVVDGAAGNNFDTGGFSNKTLFRSGTNSSPDFGPGSYIGFRSPGTTEDDWYYGYFEVTWNSTNSQFQILSGAYESTVNTPIPLPVPEPSTAALTGIGALALGAGAIRRSRRARKAAAEGALAEAV